MTEEERTKRKKAETSAGELHAQKLHHTRLKSDSENDEADTSLEIRLEIEMNKPPGQL